MDISGVLCLIPNKECLGVFVYLDKHIGWIKEHVPLSLHWQTLKRTMNVDSFIWISQILSIIVSGFISYRVYMLYVGPESLKKLITNHFSAQGLKIESIGKLNTKEKIKYGEPVIGLFRLYNYYFGVLTRKIEYTRKVELTDDDKNELTKYVELEIRNKKLTGIKEFDSYAI